MGNVILRLGCNLVKFLFFSGLTLSRMRSRGFVCDPITLFSNRWTRSHSFDVGGRIRRKFNSPNAQLTEFCRRLPILWNNEDLSTLKQRGSQLLYIDWLVVVRELCGLVWHPSLSIDCSWPNAFRWIGKSANRLAPLRFFLIIKIFIGLVVA